MEGPDEYIAKLEKQYQEELQALKDKYTNLMKQYLASCNSDMDAAPIVLTSEEEVEEPKYMTRHQKRLLEEMENPPYVPIHEDAVLSEQEGMSPFGSMSEDSLDCWLNKEDEEEEDDEEEEGESCGPPEVGVDDARNLSLFLQCTERHGYLDYSTRDKWYMRTFGNVLTIVKNNLGNETNNRDARECWDNIIDACSRGAEVTQQDYQVPMRCKCGFCDMKRNCSVRFTIDGRDYNLGHYCIALANAVLNYYTKLFSLRGRRVTVDDVQELLMLLDEITERQEEKGNSNKKHKKWD